MRKFIMNYEKFLENKSLNDNNIIGDESYMVANHLRNLYKINKMYSKHFKLVYTDMKLDFVMFVFTDNNSNGMEYFRNYNYINHESGRLISIRFFRDGEYFNNGIDDNKNLFPFETIENALRFPYLIEVMSQCKIEVNGKYPKEGETLFVLDNNHEVLHEVVITKSEKVEKNKINITFEINGESKTINMKQLIFGDGKYKYRYDIK